MNLDNSKNLLIIKSKIKKISNEYKKFKKNKFTKPSSFWDFSSSLIDYINDLSPKNMKLIRQHVALSSTGIYPLYDWGVNAFSGKSKKQLKQIPFVKKYLELIRNVPKKYHYSEPLSDPVSNIISAKIDGKLIARDGLSSQLALTNLYNMGVFDQINLRSKRCKILEIGSGFGLLAYNIKKAIKKDSTYVICDLPSTLILAATFLTNNYPNKKIYLYDPSNYSASKLPNILKKYSFVILPNYKFNDLDRILDFDLIINMASFLEMNSLQIDTYLKSIKKKKECFIYSSNHCGPAAMGNPKKPISKKNLIKSSDKTKTVDKHLSDHLTIYPKYGYYEKNNVSQHKSRVYIGYTKKINFEKKANIKTLYGTGYKINKLRYIVQDDLLNSKFAKY